MPLLEYTHWHVKVTMVLTHLFVLLLVFLIVSSHKCSENGNDILAMKCLSVETPLIYRITHSSCFRSWHFLLQGDWTCLWGSVFLLHFNLSVHDPSFRVRFPIDTHTDRLDQSLKSTSTTDEAENKHWTTSCTVCPYVMCVSYVMTWHDDASCC